MITQIDVAIVEAKVRLFPTGIFRPQNEAGSLDLKNERENRQWPTLIRIFTLRTTN